MVFIVGTIVLKMFNSSKVPSSFSNQPENEKSNIILTMKHLSNVYDRIVKIACTAGTLVTLVNAL